MSPYSLLNLAHERSVANATRWAAARHIMKLQQ